MVCAYQVQNEMGNNGVSMGTDIIHCISNGLEL